MHTKRMLLYTICILMYIIAYKINFVEQKLISGGLLWPAVSIKKPRILTWANLIYEISGAHSLSNRFHVSLH